MDYKQSVEEVLQKGLRGQETANFEFPLITKGGARVEILLNATSRRDEHGKVIGVVGIGQDITARIAQEREYVRLIDTANAPIFGVDACGLVNVWNRCACNLTGFTSDEVMGRNLVQEFITQDYQGSVQAVLRNALGGQETANFEFPLITKTGARVEILLNATSRLDPSGKISGVVGIGQDITARLAQEQEYIRLIDTANAPIFGVNDRGQVNVWNQCAFRLAGYTRDEVMGHNLVSEFISKEFKASVKQVLDNALVGKETANFQFPLLTKTGVLVEILLNATTRRDEHGRVIGVVGIGQDITARIAQEQEYVRLIDTANAPIFGVDTLGLVNVWNRCASKVTGYGREEVLGLNLVEQFVTKDFRESVQDVLQKALRGHETANFEFPLITKTGVLVEILLNATTRRDEHAIVTGAVGIGQDITGRLAQEREYARLIDTANAPIFGVNDRGLVNVWNQCASNLTGFKAEEVMGRNLVQDFITQDYQKSVQEVLKKALQGQETANFEFPLITKHGARVDILLNATTRRDEHGRVIGVVGIGQDITARIRQEKEYSRLIDTANAPIFGIDTDGLVNVWNQCASTLTGYGPEEVMGCHLVQNFITIDYQSSVQVSHRGGWGVCTIPRTVLVFCLVLSRPVRRCV
jgi:PAS domain S-box-containing protein